MRDGTGRSLNAVSRPLLDVVVLTPGDIKGATEGGADRLEVLTWGHG